MDMHVSLVSSAFKPSSSHTDAASVVHLRTDSNLAAWCWPNANSTRAAICGASVNAHFLMSQSSTFPSPARRADQFRHWAPKPD
eukprot:103884-Pyramimonas_sp.AAC.1